MIIGTFIICEILRHKMLKVNFTQVEMKRIVADPKYDGDIVKYIIEYHFAVMNLKNILRKKIGL
jgi:hypothetical protein